MVCKMKAKHEFLILAVIVISVILFVQIPMLERLGLTHTWRFYSKKENETHPKMSIPVLTLQPNFVKYSKLKSGNMILYSAIATNSSENTTWDIIAVQGWFRKKTKTNFRCCVRYSSGNIASHNNVSLHRWTRFTGVDYGALQFQCHLTSQGLGVPVKVTVTNVDFQSNLTCREDINKYLTIEFAYKRAAIAFFLKVLYGQLSYLDLLTWFEIHRAFGIDRVLGYVTENLNEKARIVLGHYQRNGLFEAFYYPLPIQAEESKMGSDQPISWNHKGVSMFDGQTRLGGYDYLVSIDANEYLLPTNPNDSFRTTFDKLFMKQQHCAGFLFKTYLFIKNWGGEQNSSFSTEKYLLRTEPTSDRIKHVVIPSRVKLGLIRTHFFKPSTNFKSCGVDTSEIAVYHFRACRRKMTTLCDKRTAVRDETVSKMFKTVEENVENIRKLYSL